MVINAIITAGGTSSRFGKNNKLLEKINGKEVIKYTVEAFDCDKIDRIVICANPSIKSELEEIFKGYDKAEIIEGGKTRQESVFRGLKHKRADYVLIHDGARPLVTREIIEKCIEKVKTARAVSVMTKTIDTIKIVEGDRIIQTLDRSKLYNTQTPQAFEYGLILEAHKKLEGESFTDDSGMVEFLGTEVFTVEGSYKNIKITTQNDIDLVKVLMVNK